MVSKKEVYKKVINGRLLKNYGSWMYCSNCNNTVGYLCYTTYQYFNFSFTCTCGSSGSFELGDKASQLKCRNELFKKKNRLCCSVDEAPLFSIVDKNLKEYSFEIMCNKCHSYYKR